MEELTCPVGR